jgi:hypothetical protein
MYMLIQMKEASGPVVWCRSDNMEALEDFCQYMIDSSREGGLDDFRVVYPGSSGKMENFYNFCREHGIRKRPFAERMGLRMQQPYRKDTGL